VVEIGDGPVKIRCGGLRYGQYALATRAIVIR
jgi:hypothetical protein